MINQQLRQYTVLSKIGEGGMATVYLARDNQFDAEVALKVLKPEFVHNPQIRNRFLEEARNLFLMTHQNLVKVTHRIDDEGLVAYAMDFVQGENLKQYLKRIGRLSDHELVHLLSQILDVLQYVHSRKVIHRDIKPSNIMIDAEGRIKLLDFGIAKISFSRASTNVTTTNIQMGTPMYMSPEQVRSTRDVDFRTDIYSLGVVLWQMVTGREPYDTHQLTNAEIQVEILRNPLHKTQTNWDAMIQRATAKNPSDRFASCNLWKESMGLEITIQKHDDIDKEDTIVQEDNNTLVENPKSESIPFIQIGTQVWMAKNLNVDTFRNGDQIPHARTAQEWLNAGNNQQPAWCYYDNDPKNGEKYGKLYNWYAVNDPRGLAPDGWRVPGDLDWMELTRFLGGESKAGKKMKSATGWNSWLVRMVKGNGTNECGFNGLPAGYRNNRGRFEDVGLNGCWWDLEEYDDSAPYRILFYDANVVGSSIVSKKLGMSVRCLKE